MASTSEGDAVAQPESVAHANDDADVAKEVAQAVAGDASEAAPVEPVGNSVAPSSAKTAAGRQPEHQEFGLATASALAVVPSMIDDNELASQTVLDESEVFDDPFYEALMAVGLVDEVADPDPEEHSPQHAADSQDAHKQNQPAQEDSGSAEEATGNLDGSDDPAIRGAHAKRPDKATAKPSAEPKTLTEPYEFSLATGSALAMLPSMIDDNELASQTVVEPVEVFDDPFYEALVATEPTESVEPVESSAPVEAIEAVEPEPVETTETAEPEPAKAELEGAPMAEDDSDRGTSPLYTTASALVDDESEEPAPATETEASTADPEPIVDAEAPAPATAESAAEPEASTTSPAVSAVDEASDATSPAAESDHAAGETPAIEDGPHAAAQEPESAPDASAAPEKLPDDESVADAVDEMVISAEPDEGKAPTSGAQQASSAAPEKRSLWSRIKGFFRRKH